MSDKNLTPNIFRILSYSTQEEGFSQSGFAAAAAAAVIQALLLLPSRSAAATLRIQQHLRMISGYPFILSQILLYLSWSRRSLSLHHLFILIGKNRNKINRSKEE